MICVPWVTKSVWSVLVLKTCQRIQMFESQDLVGLTSFAPYLLHLEKRHRLRPQTRRGRLGRSLRKWLHPSACTPGLPSGGGTQILKQHSGSCTSQPRPNVPDRRDRYQPYKLLIGPKAQANVEKKLRKSRISILIFKQPSMFFTDTSWCGLQKNFQKNKPD